MSTLFLALFVAACTVGRLVYQASFTKPTRSNRNRV